MKVVFSQNQIIIHWILNDLLLQKIGENQKETQNLTIMSWKLFVRQNGWFGKV